MSKIQRGNEPPPPSCESEENSQPDPKIHFLLKNQFQQVWVSRGWAIDLLSMGHRFCHRDFVAKFPLRPELTAGPQDPPFSLKSFPYAPIAVQILPLRAHFRQNAHMFVQILPLRAHFGQNPSLTRHFFPHNFRKWLKSFPYAHIFG